MYQVQCQKVQFSWKSKRPLNLHAISELIIPASLISFVLNLTANYHIVVAWFLLWLFRVLVIGWRHNNLETSRTLQFRILVSPIRNVSFKLKSKMSVLCARLKSTFIENRRCNYHIFRTHTHTSPQKMVLSKIQNCHDTKFMLPLSDTSKHAPLVCWRWWIKKILWILEDVFELLFKLRRSRLLKTVKIWHNLSNVCKYYWNGPGMKNFEGVKIDKF